MTTITRERIELFVKSPLENGLTRGEQMELARIALPALEAEPIGAFHIVDQQVGGTSDYIKGGEWPIDNGVIDVYSAPPVQETGVYKDMLNIIGLLENNEWAEHCTSTVLGSLLESEITRLVGKEQPAPERERIRREHAEWSDKTFGDVGPIGPLKHLSKEALEAAADPSDPLEWAGMQFLLWDAQRRMGISDEFITRAMIEKLEINKSRQWPEPKDGEPRLHIKEQPVPVVPDEWTIQDAVKFCRETGRQDAGSAMEAWNACRAAMLNGGKS
ncbi:DUF550 domain-containing protein [Salmonella enterica subsp. enterica serovar Kumasi]|nr:DUF550 domain-containing protein [Salmonella enterica]EBO8065676.1 DUF550 domain-containing protein [Salmonella enterica]EGI6276630.1 DUF550 domain-containing protein [Salmonella enterica subsp. enterica serovar Kumasi]